MPQISRGFTKCQKRFTELEEWGGGRVGRCSSLRRRCDKLRDMIWASGDKGGGGR